MAKVNKVPAKKPEAEDDDDKPAFKPGFKLPKTLAGVADELGHARDARRKIAKELKAAEKHENALKAHMIEHLPVSDATGVAGKIWRVQIVSKDKPVVAGEDWVKLYAHIKKTGEFDLLQKRVAEGAVKQRWDAEKKVPGVGKFIAKDVSITQV